MAMELLHAAPANRKTAQMRHYAYTCLSPLLILVCHLKSQSTTALFNPETSISNHKHHPYTGTLN